MPLLVHHRRAPAAAPPVSTLSIALAVVGVVTLVISGSVTAYLLYRRHRKIKARRSRVSKSSLRQVSVSSVPISAPQPAIVLAPATPALATAEAHKSIPISQLPMSTSTSTLGSALEQDDSLTHPHRSSRPFGGPGIVDVAPRGSAELSQDRASSRNTTRPRRGSTATTGSSRRSRAIPPDLLKTLGDLPSLPPGPSPIRRSFASDRADASAGTEPSWRPTANRRNSVESLDLTPVLDLGSSFRIASGIFGPSVNREGSSEDVWLTSVLDSAFNRQQQLQNQRNSRTPSPTPALSRESSRPESQADVRPGSSLTPSGSMNSMGMKRSSSRIPVSRSQRQYLDEFLRPLMTGSDMRSLGSDLESSSAASMHLSTRPSHGALTQHTAPTSVASSDSLSAATALEAQVLHAGLAQKLPATTMRVSQVFPSSTRRNHAAQSSAETARQEPASTVETLGKTAAEAEEDVFGGQTVQQDSSQIGSSLLTAPSFGGGLKSVSETNLHRGASAKTIMMQACASNVSLASPFTTPFHHAVFPDDPAQPSNMGSNPSPESPKTLAPGSSPARAQMDSTTPKISPRPGFASQWKARLSRRVTMHSNPQRDSARPINYIKSSSHLNLNAANVDNCNPSPTFNALAPGLSPSHYAASPDVSSSFNQEEWRINTEDSRDSFSPMFTPSHRNHDVRKSGEERSRSGLGICVADDDETHTLSGSRTVSPHRLAQEPHSPAHSDLSQGFEYQRQVRKRQKTSPIMQQERWATHQQPTSPSIYGDDAKSFVSSQYTHAGQSRPVDGASIFDFDALNAGISPRLRVDAGSMSPLDRMERGFQSGNQCTPVMKAGRFTDMSPGGLSPYSAAGQRRSSPGRPTSRMVATLHQVEDGMVDDKHSSDFSCHASPRSEMGLFDMASASSCFSAAVTVEGDTSNAVSARAKLLQSVQADTSREQDRQSEELQKHQRRAAEAEASDIQPVESGVISIIEEELEEASDYTVMPSSPGATLPTATRPFPGSLQNKKPQGLSIYVGNAGGSLGRDVVSPLTPPFTPAKTSIEATYFARRMHHRDAASNGSQSNSQRSQSSLRSEAEGSTGSEESHDVVPELASSGSATGSQGATSVSLTPASTSPFKLRPLSLSTSTSVLGENADSKMHSSPHAPSAWTGNAGGHANSTPTKRTSVYRSSRLFGIHTSESNGSLASGTTSSHGLGMYSQLTSALGLDNSPVPNAPLQATSKRGSFAYKSPTPADALRSSYGTAIGH
ncbi:unnamed protein product [Sympodiomycopsis kandeliae]